VIIKNNVKNNALIFGVFVTGMLSVSIANLFGGYYCFVAAIVVVLGTLFTFNVLDNKSLEENKIELILISILAFFELMFFLVNDVIGYPVYVKNNFNFTGICVMASQFYSIVVLAYSMIKIVLSFYKKDEIELIDNVEKAEDKVDEKKEEIIEEAEEVLKEKKVEESKPQEMKRITETNVRKQAPFMEEGK